MQPHVHDSITRVRGSYFSAIAGIKLLKMTEIPVEIKTPILWLNKNEYFTVREFAIENGFSFTCSPCIFPKTDGSLASLVHSLDENNLKEEMSKIDQLNRTEHTAFQLTDDICRVLKYSLFVNANGDVFPCGSFPLKLGNVLGDSLRSIWEGEAYLNLRMKKRSSQLDCVKCKLSDKCNACPGIAYLESGDYLSCSKICRSIATARQADEIVSC